MKTKYKELSEQFKVEVHDHGDDIDPAYELNWHALTVGWALGKGLDPDSAKAFASYIEYQTNLG